MDVVGWDEIANRLETCNSLQQLLLKAVLRCTTKHELSTAHKSRLIRMPKSVLCLMDKNQCICVTYKSALKKRHCFSSGDIRTSTHRHFTETYNSTKKGKIDRSSWVSLCFVIAQVKLVAQATPVRPLYTNNSYQTVIEHLRCITV